MRFDGVAADPVEVPRDRLAAALAAITDPLREAIEASAANVRAVAAAQIGEPAALTLAAGQRIEVAEVAVGSAAIYVPGGRAPYPSSVVMGVVPARVAGVGRVVVASPPEAATGEPAPAVLAAAAIAGADAVYAVGGAQAIAALAHGTGSIPAVDVIAGPGSPWVQEAKLQCSRRVGIDGYAGPSELVVIATEEVSREWIALDLCAQAEHGDDGMLVAIATDAAWLEGLAESIEAVQARRDDVGDSTFELIAVGDVDAAVALTEALAPEHARGDHRRRARGRPPADDCGLRLRRRRPRRRRSATTRPGRTTCCRPAAPGRFAGPLGPGTFRRRISRVEIDAAAASALAETVDEIARAEGFPLHGRSAIARTSGRNGFGEGE